MTFATLDDLRLNLGRKTPDPAYAAKMLHAVPEAPVVDRAGFLLSVCKGEVVLDIGASGPMHREIVKVAATCYGIDRVASDGVVGIDLDDPKGEVPAYPNVTRIVCGEVLEHLANPGLLLTRLARGYPSVEMFITVPNALSEIARAKILTGTENVNADHVCWYSWKTMTTLLTRYGYVVKGFCWYNGKPLTAEGLIFVVETPAHG